jgi:hypothetical protein
MKKILSSIYNKPRGRPKSSKKTRKSNVIIFRLNQDLYDKLEEHSKPNTPHLGARALIEQVFLDKDK